MGNLILPKALQIHCFVIANEHSILYLSHKNRSVKMDFFYQGAFENIAIAEGDFF